LHYQYDEPHLEPTADRTDRSCLRTVQGEVGFAPRTVLVHFVATGASYIVPAGPSASRAPSPVRHDMRCVDIHLVGSSDVEASRTRSSADHAGPVKSSARSRRKPTTRASTRTSAWARLGHPHSAPTSRLMAMRRPPPRHLLGYMRSLRSWDATGMGKPARGPINRPTKGMSPDKWNRFGPSEQSLPRPRRLTPPGHENS
jgi:hypothetical protein